MNWIDGGFNRYMATPINLIHVDVDGFSLGVPPVDQSELGGFFSHQKTGIPNDAGMTRTTVPGLLTKKKDSRRKKQFGFIDYISSESSACNGYHRLLMTMGLASLLHHSARKYDKDTTRVTVKPIFGLLSPP